MKLAISDKQRASRLRELTEAYLVSEPDRFQEAEWITITYYCWEFSVGNTYFYYLVNIAWDCTTLANCGAFIQDWTALFYQVLPKSPKKDSNNFSQMRVVKCLIKKPDSSHEIMAAQALWQEWQESRYARSERAA